FDQPALRRLVGSDSVTFRGDAVTVTLHEGVAAAATVSNQPARKSSSMPAAVTRQYGKGRVVYLPAGIDAAYYLYPYPYDRLLIKQAMLSVAADEPPVQIDAPMCVQM